MKRKMIIGFVIPYLVTMVLGGSATFPINPLSPSDGPDLIGK